MNTFKAFRIHQEGKGVRAVYETLGLDDLSAGEVVIKVAYSGINYKDALAATGQGAILRRFPLVGGIDLSGVVVSSADPAFKPGDRVLVAGANLSETEDGGYAEYARVKADSVVPLPDSLSLSEAMGIGTAGFTAALAIDRMELNGQRPENGPVIVTGATGGVGSLAIDMLAGLGYEVAAFTGKAQQADYLKRLGASELVLRQEQDFGHRPLEKALWAGAIDNVGGETLAWLTRTLQPNGNIGAIGLAGGAVLETTVMPFILRGVNLLGINSVFVTPEKRRALWARIGADLKPRHLDTIITDTIAFDALPTAFDAYIKGNVTGHTVVRIGGEID
ncbi:oxidoreductase [Granulosicoccaceae sp. 1_MG-2023]|nr:oxidoreductase [Granulosicoccaceae sp. 1_MG-2023]